jgi:hypothetical protein
MIPDGQLQPSALQRGCVALVLDVQHVTLPVVAKEENDISHRGKMSRVSGSQQRRAFCTADDRRGIYGIPMRTAVTLMVVLCSSSFCGAWSLLRASTLQHSRVQQQPSLIATRLLESSVTTEVTTEKEEDATSFSTLATPASTDKANDEVHWIRDGLLKAAFSSDLHHDEDDKDKDSEVGVIPKGQAVVGPSTVLIYDTTLRGTCWKGPRACRFLRTRWFVYNARRVCLILADTHMNSQLAHRAIP